VLLHVQAILETQRQELFFGQFARQAAPDLVAELGDPFGHQGRIIFVVLVHLIPGW